MYTYCFTHFDRIDGADDEIAAEAAEQTLVEVVLADERAAEADGRLMVHERSVVHVGARVVGVVGARAVVQAVEVGLHAHADEVGVLGLGEQERHGRAQLAVDERYLRGGRGCSRRQTGAAADHAAQ